MVEYRVRGAYFESCNCDAICPCRMVGGRRGGRSTHGICFGTLSWRIGDGRVGDVDVAGLCVALVYRYDDDEPGSPWTIVLHVDERGDERQRAALANVFLGRLVGPHVTTLPWVRKPAHLIEVHPSAIDLVPEGRGYRLRVGESVRVAASRAVETDEPARASFRATTEPAPSCTPTRWSPRIPGSTGSSRRTALSQAISSTCCRSPRYLPP